MKPHEFQYQRFDRSDGRAITVDENRKRKGITDDGLVPDMNVAAITFSIPSTLVDNLVNHIGRNFRHCIEFQLNLIANHESLHFRSLSHG